MNFIYNPLITVVIPVYNVEKYLRQCLDSVINQTYSKLEIICVNDCTQDNCVEILKEYAAKDSRIKVINNPKNIGLGLTRNEGIKASTGEYIHCLDSDDWIELNMYETLVDYLNRAGKVDIIRFTYNRFNMKTGKFFIQEIPESDYEIFNIFDKPNMAQRWEPSAWVKILRADFIKENNVYYNDHRCFEDVGYSVLSLIKAKSICFTNETLLNYRSERKGSLLRNRLDYLDCLLEDVQTSNKLTENFPEDVKNNIRFYTYKYLFYNTRDAYYYNKISYETMRKIIIDNLPYDILENCKSYKVNGMEHFYFMLINYSKWHLFLSYKVKRFIRTNFPTFTKIYLKIKGKK